MPAPSEQGDLFQKWLQKERKLWNNRKRKYLHFDERIDIREVEESLQNFFEKEGEKTHSFYPFIKDVIVTPRYKRIEQSDGTYKREKSKKERNIAYASHFDAFIYSWYSTVINDKYEKKIRELGIEDSITAYLKKPGNPNNIDFAKEVFEKIKDQGECAVLTLDISDFFDQLDHRILKENWKRLLNESSLPETHYKIFKSLTNYAFVHKQCLLCQFPEVRKKLKRKKRVLKYCQPEDFRNKVRGKGLIKRNHNRNEIEKSPRYGKMCGIPQGSPLSATLSNVYMLDFDKEIHDLIEKKGGLYRRYSDDLLLICPIDEINNIESTLSKKIEEYELKNNDEKKDITYFKKVKGKLQGISPETGKEKKIQYLGLEYDGSDILVRSSTISRYYKKLRAHTESNLRKAYKKGRPDSRLSKEKVLTKKLIKRFSHQGKDNFISYIKRAEEKIGNGKIKRQVMGRESDVLKEHYRKKEKLEKKWGIKNPKK